VIALIPPPSFWDSISDFFHMKPDPPESNLNITKFGSFTANFRALPAPIPPEYVATLIGVVATAFVGTWLTPALIGWRKTKMQLKSHNNAGTWMLVVCVILLVIVMPSYLIHRTFLHVRIKLKSSNSRPSQNSSG
jgi:hypothetical protein